MTKEFKDVMQLFQKQIQLQQQQIAEVIVRLKTSTETSIAPLQAMSTARFAAFDSLAELWKDYWARFKTFAKTNFVPKYGFAQIFLTNKSADTYKLLSTLATQQTPPKSTDYLTMEESKDFMDTQYYHKHYIVRKRYRFWSSLQREPGETI